MNPVSERDPRKLGVSLPAGFLWSRRILDGDARGRWCLIYETRFFNLCVRAPGGTWTSDNAEDMIEKMIEHGEVAQQEVFAEALAGECAGNA